ncbi:hypothetical protein BV898_19116 [Hypsibius exemplaris]|uniref:Uncharacterized protein n=1 Tax=Hypsibius exemplaris TaxID=2072580 RepID=A0A9X6NIP7_HYPEX|nr:hypothetical protein BV898_19116 [Hypsibius exemplaris]
MMAFAGVRWSRFQWDHTSSFSSLLLTKPSAIEWNGNNWHHGCDFTPVGNFSRAAIPVTDGRQDYSLLGLLQAELCVAGSKAAVSSPVKKLSADE